MISLHEWEGVYDTKKCIVLLATTPAKETISEHMCKHLCATFKADAALTMDSYVKNMHGRGIEFLDKALSIFNPKWPPSDHSNEKIDLYQLFCHSNNSVDT